MIRLIVEDNDYTHLVENSSFWPRGVICQPCMTVLMLTLSQRRKQHKLSFMYNVNAGLVPSYISDLIPPLVMKFQIIL